MHSDITIRRAQVYSFLAGSMPYPHENWLDDAPSLEAILRDFDAGAAPRWQPEPPVLSLEALQEAHRLAFGATGSLCYETEYGLPHEFRQSQELADIAGFYRAFGFDAGGPSTPSERGGAAGSSAEHRSAAEQAQTRERPDYVGAELEFMFVLALKEAYAQANGMTEQLEICVDAQRKFVEDHLGQWIGLFALGVERTAAGGPYAALARFASEFVAADAGRLGARPESRQAAQVLPTPLAPDLSCDACPAIEVQVQGGEE